MIILMIILMILMIFYNNREYSDCKIIFCSCFRVFVLACFLLLPFVGHVPASEVLGTLIGSLSNDDADGNENDKKAIGLFSKTTTLHVHHAFVVHFFAVVAQLQRESA